MNLSLGIKDVKPMKLAIAGAIACGMLLALPGCHLLPVLRKPEAAPTLPPDFKGAASSDNSSQLGVEEFYNDPVLTCLIQKAMVGNRELKVLNEEIQIARNEVLARSGAYLPFASLGTGSGLNRVSRFTGEGAGLIDDPYLPGKFFNNPHGNFMGGLNLTWQLDIYRQLRNAQDAAADRYVAASERRNFFVTRLVADIAENYYRLMALDKRLENLDQTIDLQLQSLKIAQARLDNGRGDQLAVLRFQADVRRNQSEKLIINQDIIEAENRVNFLVNRFPQPVERVSAGFYDLTLHGLSMGVPSELLRNRPDIRQAERELAASGLDVKVARVNFFPQLVITGGVGLEAFNLRYLFEPQAVAGNIAGGLVAPFVNFRAIRAQYLTANARQLQAVYNYQRVVLNAFTEVVNRLAMAENYSRSIDLKRQQLASLEAAVPVATNLFQNARTEYLDVLIAQRDLRDARTVLIDTKLQQLTAIVNAYQALGGGDLLSISTRTGFQGQTPFVHTVREGESFRSLSLLYYKSARYEKALCAANKKTVSDPGRLVGGEKIVIPRIEQLDPALIEDVPGSLPAFPDTVPVVDPAVIPPPPPASLPGRSARRGTKDNALKASNDSMPPANTPKPTTEM